MRQKYFAHGETVLRHGDRAQHLWLVRRGWVKLSRQTPDGKETTVGLCTEGDVFGESALSADASYAYHAEIVSGEAELACIPAKNVQAAIHDDPRWASTILSMLNERIAQTQLRLEQSSTMSTAQRLGCFLLRLCRGETGDGATLQIPVEKHVLASYLGMKPETFSRSLQQLKTVGVEAQGAQLSVASVRALSEYVCISCSQSGSCQNEA